MTSLYSLWELLTIPWLQKELGEGKLEPSWVLCVTTSFPGWWGLTGVFLWFCNNSEYQSSWLYLLIVKGGCFWFYQDCIKWVLCFNRFLLQACFENVLFFPLCRLINSDRIEIEYQINPPFLVFILNVIFIGGRKGINFVLSNYNLLSSKTLLILIQLILK